MKRIKLILVVGLALVAIAAFPIGMLSFIAAESDLTQVILRDGGEDTLFRVAAETVEGFLVEAGIETNTHDRLSHARHTILTDGMIVTIEREVAFYVQKNGGEPFARTGRPGITPIQVLRQLQEETDTALLFRDETGVAFSLNDASEASAAFSSNDTSATGRDRYTPVLNGEVLSFNTFSTRFEVEYIPLPYQVTENHTSAVSAGRQRMRIYGEEGVKAITTAIVYIAGEEVNREVVSVDILNEPVYGVLDIGTGWLGSLTDVTCESFHYYRRLRMEATAYTAYYSCTGKHPDDPWFGITASGRRVEHGIVAVDRNVIPLGTRLYVENYGFAIAADVGGAIRGYSIDLYMYTLEEARRFGRRHIYVWVLDDIFSDGDEDYVSCEDYAVCEVYENYE